MKRNIFPAIAALGLALLSCQPKTEQPAAAAPEKSSAEAPKLSAASIDSLAGIIDQQRKEIESKDLKPIEVSTTGLRAKIRQKWSNIHFYEEQGQVVRIKTYPHDNISKRTEEFYAGASGLMLVVIEDDGSGAKGKDEQVTKMYYYHQDAPLKEFNGEKETEYGIRSSDAEELMAEYREYLDIYKNAKK